MDTLPGRGKANEKRVDTQMKAFIFFLPLDHSNGQCFQNRETKKQKTQSSFDFERRNLHGIF